MKFHLFEFKKSTFSFSEILLDGFIQFFLCVSKLPPVVDCHLGQPIELFGQFWPMILITES